MTDESKQAILERANTILENIDLIEGAVSWLRGHKDELLNLTLGNHIEEVKFYKLTSLLSTQIRSPLWEKYFRVKNGYEAVPTSADRGDLRKGNQFYEYKISLNDQVNFRLLQIRVWQECDYIFQFVTFERVYTFQLTKNQMLEEMKRIGANSAHGTQEANKSNKNIEYTMTLIKDSEHWTRWIRKYEMDTSLPQ